MRLDKTTPDCIPVTFNCRCRRRRKNILYTIKHCTLHTALLLQRLRLQWCCVEVTINKHIGGFSVWHVFLLKCRHRAGHITAWLNNYKLHTLLGSNIDIGWSDQYVSLKKQHKHQHSCQQWGPCGCKRPLFSLAYLLRPLFRWQLLLPHCWWCCCCCCCSCCWRSQHNHWCPPVRTSEW